MMKLILAFVATVSVKSAPCSQRQLENLSPYFPNLYPHGSDELEMQGYELVWSSRLTNNGRGPFQFVNGLQEITNARGRTMCEVAAPIPVEKFYIFSADGTFISQADKQVWCLMDSEGGTSDDDIFLAQYCNEDGTGAMGISPMGTDLYGLTTEAQRLDTRGWAPGRYFIVTKLNLGATIQVTTEDDISFTEFGFGYRNFRGRPRPFVRTLGQCDGTANCLAYLNEIFGDDAASGYLGVKARSAARPVTAPAARARGFMALPSPRREG